ncbi:hypothetical protein JCM10914A_18620 [Paenibacillus sp. JCM 10914]
MNNMIKAKVDDQDDMHNMISNTTAGNPKILVIPTSRNSGQKIMLVSRIKLAIGLFSFCLLVINTPRFKLGI